MSDRGHDGTERRDDEFCGAKKHQGAGTCRRTAGWGTSHVGTGACKLHGGCTPNHEKAAARAWAERLRAELDRPTVVDANDALLGELYRTHAFVGWMQRGFAETEGVDESAAMERWYEPLTRERRHLLDVAKAAIALGLAEREVRMAEQHGQLLAAVIRAVLADPELGLSRDQHDRAPVVVRRHLSAVAGQIAS